MKEKENFLDKNTLIAIALLFVAWLSWDAYMKKKYPSRKTAPTVLREEKVKSVEERQAVKQDGRLSVGEGAVSKRRKKVSEKRIKAPLKEQLFSFQSEVLSFDVSSIGMGFKKLILNKILDREEKAIWLFSGEEHLPFETRLGGKEAEPLYFYIKQVSDYVWEGEAVWNGITIEKTLSVNPELFLVKAKIKVSGDLGRISGISTLLSQTQKSQDKEKSFLSFFVQPDFLSFFISSSRGFEQIPLMSEKDSEKLQFQEPFHSVKTAALGTKYFGQAWIEDKSDVLPQFQVVFKDDRYLGVVHHSILNSQQDFNVSYKMFVGPKDLSFLKREYPQLIHWVDFGWFGTLSRFILQILQFFYSLVNNWGVSIILLTLLVRSLLLPLVISSHRSVEVMKKVQPEIQKIRTKFKKDPQRMNQEVMALMKSHRANPLGGCLPLLLQVPVFWSLWKALSGSYSLYRAPFVFWIRDLSWKDPYYVLPVLMGVFWFIQQKVSPVTGNKEMVRVMQIMPIFMTLFMINLPSGLVLYMLVSTLFGLIQQLYLNKKGASVSVSVGKTGSSGKDKK